MKLKSFTFFIKGYNLHYPNIKGNYFALFPRYSLRNYNALVPSCIRKNENYKNKT